MQSSIGNHNRSEGKRKEQNDIAQLARPKKRPSDPLKTPHLSCTCDIKICPTCIGRRGEVGSNGEKERS